MDPDLSKELHARGLISDTSLQRVQALENHRLFSLHWELKTLLYLGVLLLSGGLGFLVYKNIATIGHQAVLIFIALVSAASFAWCIRNKTPFSFGKADPPNAFFDYILLLACLTFITFIGYLQFQYRFFGEAYGLATLIPMVVLFVSAYYFDHLGILSLAITNLAAWMGIVVTPLRILKDNDFDSNRLIYTGLALGLILVLAGLASIQRNFKKHFEFTYTNFGIHILFIAGLAGIFQFDKVYLAWFLLLLGLAFYFYRLGLRRSSFYFLVVVVIYTYIAISYTFIRLISEIVPNGGSDALYIELFYFIFSAIAVVRVLIILNRKVKNHDSV
jgi:hypothetical protein